jgi:DNA-binding response OmpR family regulator
LLRGCCEAYASGAALDLETMRAHPAVRRRIDEFWEDAPSSEAVSLSGLAGVLLLARAAAAPRPDLTAGEHRLLVYLQAHPDAVCEKDDLIRAVWPDEQVSAGLRDDSLAQLVRRLREKVESDPSHPARILTVPGRGYRFHP